MHGRKSFFYVLIIFVAVVVKGNRIVFGIVFIYAGGRNDGPAQVPPNIFYDVLWFAAVRFRIYIKTIFMIFINGRYDFFERSRKFFSQFFQESGLKGIAHEDIVKVGFTAPKSGSANPSFG